MAENSKIEWCHHTVNLWRGCDRVSPGCLHCYAAAIDLRFAGGENWKGKRKDQRQSGIELAKKLDRRAERQGIRYRVFNGSMNDWLDAKVPIEWLYDLLDVIRRTPHLDWLLLTKRPENWTERLTYALGHALLFSANITGPTRDFISEWIGGKPPENVWIGTTAEDQTRANERLPLLMEIPAGVRFLSCEPLLGHVDLFAACFNDPDESDQNVKFGVNHSGLRFGVDWVICGGESGVGARPMNPDWARSLRQQCKAAGVPFLFKQWGEWVRQSGLHHHSKESRIVPFGDEDASNFRRMYRVGKKISGRLLDGIEHNEFPKVEGSAAR